MPSGESTPSASGLDSRCSPSCSLTSGGPSRRRLVEYQKLSGIVVLLSSRPIAFRAATLYRRLSSCSRSETSYHPDPRRRHSGWEQPTWEGLPGTTQVHPSMPWLHRDALVDKSTIRGEEVTVRARRG